MRLWVWLRQRFMVASTESVSVLPLLPSPRQAWAVSYISEEGTTLSNLGCVPGAGCVSQQGTMCYQCLYLSWWTTSTRKMGQNVLAKRSASHLMSPPMFAETVDIPGPFLSPREKGLGTRLRCLLTVLYSPTAAKILHFSYIPSL